MGEEVGGGGAGDSVAAETGTWRYRGTGNGLRSQHPHGVGWVALCCFCWLERMCVINCIHVWIALVVYIYAIHKHTIVFTV